MPNHYYVPGQKRAARVGDLFATIAPRYDLINDLQSFGLHRLWKRKLVRLANVTPGQRALDVCCGTGDVTFALADQGAIVTGLDFSEPMLNVARRRLFALGRRASQADGQPLFLRADATQLPFAENTFDVATVSYGLRNLTDWRVGLEEMVRVTRSGGRILVLDFGKPDNPAWQACYFAYLRAGVPVFGRIFCGDTQTHAYILTSLQHYPAQRGVAAHMREIGCLEVRIILLLGGIMTINYGVKP
ncbi:MAG TPA: ubiquinone/menaquinone biosynthesis methyltransferase [Verrucomicrobiae bacterium]|nr:ubiquinone/menaquinone biosynthesis methyltransferase [Verrucomicrobiae bacterium]